jgi:hypothetical protein
MIPGRRIEAGETLRTDWVPRGGDCVILRVQILSASPEGVSFELETRGEDGATITTMTATEPSGGLDLSTAGVFTCLYLATTSTSAGNGAQEQVRVVVTGGNPSDPPGFCVVRIFPLIFFDSAKPLTP